MNKRCARSSARNANPAAKSKMDYKDFVTKAIKSLREPPYKGIHVVYSNFNNAFRQYYDEDPRPIIDKMITEGFLVSRVTRGGAIIMLASDVDENAKVENGSSVALAKILTQSD